MPRIRLSPSGPFAGATLAGNPQFALSGPDVVPAAAPLFTAIVATPLTSVGAGTQISASYVAAWMGAAADQIRFRLRAVDSLGATVALLADYKSSAVPAALAAVVQQVVGQGSFAVPAATGPISIVLEASSLAGAPVVLGPASAQDTSLALLVF